MCTENDDVTTNTYYDPTDLGSSSLGVQVPVAATRDDLVFTDDLLNPTSQAFENMERIFCAEVN